MKRFTAAAAVIGMLLASVPAAAITNGEADGTRHASVGALIAELTPGTKQVVCSGTLVSSTVFVTAAHCTAELEARGIPRDRVWVSFAADVDPVPPTLHRGSWVTNPAYDPKTGLGDLAVVGFASAVPEAAPARLPTAGLLDRTPLELFTTVGYGLQGPEGPYDGLRRRAVSAFRSLDKAWLNLATSAKKSLGGTCFGDSGGPSFLGSGSSETEIVAALTVTGDTQCRSRSENLRLDTAASRAFLGRFVSLP